MIRILCYGDSNTWGAIPGNFEKSRRFDNRWTRLLQTKLGNNFEVVEEGLRSRTTSFDDVKEHKGNRNGAVYFNQAIFSHDPLSYVIIFLGTNDLKYKFNSNANISANNIETYYIKTIKNCSNDLIITPKIILIAPSIVKEGFIDGFDGASEKSLEFNSVYQNLAKKHNCLFVGNESLVVGVDGVHLTQESHNWLAQKLYEIIKQNEEENKEKLI